MSSYYIFRPIGNSGKEEFVKGFWGKSEDIANFKKDGVPYHITNDKEDRIFKLYSHHKVEGKLIKQYITLANPVFINNAYFLIKSGLLCTRPNLVNVCSFKFVYEDDSFTVHNLIVGEHISEWTFDMQRNDMHVIPHRIPPNIAYWFRSRTDVNLPFNGHIHEVKFEPYRRKRVKNIEMWFSPTEDAMGVIVVNAITIECNSSERPLNPKEGEIWWNIETKQLEIFNGLVWEVMFTSSR